MPVRHLKRRPTGKAAEDLRQELIEELRAPRESGQPEVLFEGGGKGQPVHVYVIWDQWGDLPQQERSDVIMDAYEEHYGQDEALNVTVAMGLTSDEARRMGIEHDEAGKQ
jgi:hypothetical protein